MSDDNLIPFPAPAPSPQEATSTEIEAAPPILEGELLTADDNPTLGAQGPVPSLDRLVRQPQSVIVSGVS